MTAVVQGLTLLGPQSRFGGKLRVIRVLCPHIWECGANEVKEIKKMPLFVPRIEKQLYFD